MTLDIKALKARIKSRFVDEDGAVSVDWVVLTAAIVGVAALSASTITDAVSVLSTSIGSEVSGKQVTNGD